MKPDNAERGREVEVAACAICGREAAIVVDGTGWCASCLHARGSCCAESEMEQEAPEPSPPPGVTAGS